MKKTALNIRLLLMFSVILLVAGVIMPSKRVSADEPEALGAVIESVDLMPYRNPLDATAVFYVPDELKEGKNEGEENLGSLESEFKERLYRALVAHEEYFDIEEFEIHDIGVVDRIFNELIAEHPDILYSEPYCSQYWTSTWNGVTTITHLYFVYEITVEEASMLQNACERAYLGLNDSMSDEQKLIYLHDYLVTHCQYDTSYTYYDAFSAMVRHTAVCQGYAAAFEIMTRVLGFDANMVTSVYLNHAWNIITLDGVEYYIDCTWDDPLFDTESYCGHNNLLRSRDGMVATGHTKGRDPYDQDKEVYADDWEIDGEFVFNTRAINSTKYETLINNV